MFIHYKSTTVHSALSLPGRSEEAAVFVLKPKVKIVMVIAWRGGGGRQRQVLTLAWGASTCKEVALGGSSNCLPLMLIFSLFFHESCQSRCEHSTTRRGR